MNFQHKTLDKNQMNTVRIKNQKEIIRHEEKIKRNEQTPT